MARGVGVEISDRSVRVAVVEHSARRVRLLSFHEQPIAEPAERSAEPAEKNAETAEKAQKAADERVAEALRAAVTQIKPRGARAAASLDSGDAIVRELALPFKAEDQIKKTYRFELESLIHNYAIEDLVCDYFRIGETDKGATILAAAVPRAVVERRLQIFQRAGVEAAALDLDVTALFNAIAPAGAIETDEPFLIVYGTARFTKIILVEKRRPRSIRTIRFSFPTTESTEHEIEERRKHRQWETQHGVPAPIVILTETDIGKLADDTAGLRASLVDILAKEISRFLLANAAAATPACILLAGDCESEEAARLLEAGTQIPVRRLGLLTRIEHELDAAQATTAGMRAPVAVGLALKACDADELGLDFRRQEYAYGKKYDAVKQTALVTLELVIVLLGAIALHFWFQAADFRRDYWGGDPERPGIMERHARLYKDATGEEITDPEAAYAQLVEKHRKLVEKLGGGDHPIERSALELAGQFFRALQKLQESARRPIEGRELYVLIEDMAVTQNTTSGSGAESAALQVRGVIQSEAYGEALQKCLRAVEPFADKAWTIEVSEYTGTREGMRHFTMRIGRAKKKP